MFNSLSKLDRRLIVICLICIVAVSYLLSHPEYLNRDSREDKDSIGQVTEANADIRRKSKQDYFWQKTYVNSYVSKNDTIYTGSKSSAEIKLNDGKILKVAENSLIRFTSVNKTISIDLAFGQVAATGLNKTFTITDCGKQYTVDATQASFELSKKKDCGNFDLKVSKGTVLVNKKTVTKAAPKKVVAKTILAETQEEKKIEVEKPTVASAIAAIKPSDSFFTAPIAATPPPPPPPEPQIILPPPTPAPVVEEKVILTNPKFITRSQKMLFKDESVHRLEWAPVPKADFYTLDVADNSSFTNSTQSKVVDTHYDFQAPKGGNYFFKVKAMTSKGVESPTSDPLQLALTYPSIQLKNKYIKAQYKARNSKDPGASKNFPVGWSSVDAADKYVVEVDKDPNFSKPTKFVSRRPSSVIPVPPASNVHYRVSAYDKAGRKISSTNQPGVIDYQKIFNMTQPMLEKSLKSMSYYFQKDFAQFIWLKWNSASNDDRKKFRLEISKTPSFEKIDSAFNTSDTKFLIKNKLEGGEYFWRVRSENESQFSDWSDLGHFKITTRK